MKKLAIAALALVVSTAAHAQFESGKQYIGASMTGLNLSYNGSQELLTGGILCGWKEPKPFLFLRKLAATNKNDKNRTEWPGLDAIQRGEPKWWKRS